MSVSLSLHDLTRLEAVSRALLSPLVAPDVDAWRETVVSAFRELLWTDHTLFVLPLEQGLDYFSPDMDADATGRFGSYLYEPTPGTIASTDPALDLWFRRRRQARLGLYSDLMMDATTDFQYTRSAFFRDAVQGGRMFDHQGFSVDLPTGEAMLCLSYARQGSARPPWDRVTVLRSLGPSLHTGLTMLLRLDAHRVALDALHEPLAAYDADGHELHRNAALRNLLARAADGAVLERALTQLAAEMRRLAFGLRRDSRGVAQPTCRVPTPGAAYTLRGALLPAGTFASTESFMITVQREQAPLAFPDAATLRAQLGLTKREAETALLVARGLSNDEIADALFVSRHTVRHHVESIMAKLDLTGRGRGAIAIRLLGGALA